MGRLIKEPIAGGTRVNTRLSPFVMPVERFAPSGSTIAQIIEMHKDAGRNAIVWVNGERVPKCMWHQVRPKTNALVTVSLVSGGGGGGGGKSPLRMILTIAVLIVATVVTAGVAGAFAAGGAMAGFGGALGFTAAGTSIAGLVAGAVAGATVSMVGGMLVNALAPATSQPQSGYSGSYSAGTTTATTYTITGSQNRANQYGPIPRVFGRRKVFPVYAAVPYDEVVGTDQYIRMLFSFGAGPLDLSDFRIGETPLSLYEGVETEIRYGYSDDAPITLYSHTVHEDSISARLYSGIARTFESRAQADELSFDIGFQGLVTYDSSANRTNNTVEFTVEYRNVNDVDFTTYSTETVTAATDQTYKHNVRIITPANGKYQVRVTRTTADNTSTSVRNESYFSVLRSITYTPPIGSGINECLVALRMKASGQLNGTISNLSAIAEALIPTLNEDLTWTAPQKTRNPAYAALEVMRGSLNMRPVADSKIVLSAFKDWADFCNVLDQNGEPRFQYDAVIDGVTTVQQLVTTIMGSARGMMSRPGGKISVAIDHPQTTYVQMFTPRELQSFKLKRTFYDMPHAVRARFVNPEKEWNQDEVIAYADGYSESNATLFEVLELTGVVRPSQAWRDARYHLAAAIARPNEYELVCDINHLMCERGRMIAVQHDVTRWGLGSGRVIERAIDGSGNIVSLTFDETFLLESSKSYSLRCRLSTGELILLTLTTPTGGYEGSTVELAGVLLDADGPQIGDLCAFGETGRVTVNLIVKHITRQGDLNATVVCVDEAPGVHTADTGPLPTFDTQTNWPGQGTIPQAPSPPVIDTVVSDETVMVFTSAGYIPAVRFTFAQASGFSVHRDYLEARWKRTGTGESWNYALFPNAPSTISITGVDDQGVYDFEFRYVAGVSYASNWTPYSTYTVAGRVALPPDVFGLQLVQNQLIWQYGSRPLDFAGFRVLYNFGTSTVRSGAIEAHTGTLLDVAVFPITAVPVTEITFLVVAVDTLGNESAVPAVIYRDLQVYLPGRFGDLVISNIIETIDMLDSPVIADDSVVFWGAPTDPFWGAPTDPFWLTINYLPFSVVRLATPSTLWTPVQMTLAWMATAGAVVDYQRFGDAVFWGAPTDPFWGAPTDPFWIADGPYAPWPGSAYLTEGQSVAIRISVPGGLIQGVVSSLVASFDVPDIFEDLTSVAISAGGTRLPLAKTYRVIKAVQNVTLLQDGGSAVSVQFADKDAVLGPLAYCSNSAGSHTAGTIDCSPKGY